MERNQTRTTWKQSIPFIIAGGIIIGSWAYSTSKVMNVLDAYFEEKRNLDNYEIIRAIDMEPEEKYVTKWYMDNKPFGSLDSIIVRFIQEGPYGERKIATKSINSGNGEFERYRKKYGEEIFPKLYPKYVKDKVVE